MEMISLFLESQPELRALIECFASEDALESSMVEYARPEVRECGGFFGLGCKTYEIECYFDRCLFDVCTRFRKEEFYGLAKEQIRRNYAVVRLVHRVALEALEMRKEPDEVLARLAGVYESVYRYVLNVIYAWLMLMDERKLRSVLNQLLEHMRLVADQLPGLVQRFRDDVLVVSANQHHHQPPPSQRGDEDDDDDAVVLAAAASAAAATAAPAKRKRQ